MTKRARKPRLKKDGTPRKKPPYNKNTAIRSALRRAFSRSPVVWEVLKEGRRYYAKYNKDKTRAKKDGVETHCQVCNQWTRAPMKVAVDHKDPVVPVETDQGGMDDLNVFVARLWCDKSNLQRICKTCHDEKTKAEREARKAYKLKLTETVCHSTSVSSENKSTTT